MPGLLRLRVASSDLITVAASIVGLLPGFLLPFLSSVILNVSVSDALLLAFSIYVLLTSVVGYSIEANTLAQHANSPYGPDFTRCKYLTSALLTGIICGLVTGFLLIPVYGSQTPRAVDFFALAFPFILAGIVTSVSAVFSGIVIGQHRTWLAVSSQGLRTMPALVVLIGAVQASPYFVAWAVLTGETVRCMVLFVSARGGGRSDRSGPDGSPWTLRGAQWQIVAATASQVSPVIDRWFLSSGMSGSVTTYEIADKVYFAAMQLFLSAFILRRVSMWRPKSIDSFEKLFRRDAALLGIGAACLLPFLVGGVILLLFLSWLPAGAEAGLVWSIILLAGLPFAVTHLLCVRALIALEKQSWLLPLTIVSVASNIALDYILFRFFGSVGIAWATLAVRVLVAGAYWAALSRLFLRRRRSINEECSIRQDAERREDGATNAV